MLYSEYDSILERFWSEMAIITNDEHIYNRKRQFLNEIESVCSSESQIQLIKIAKNIFEVRALMKKGDKYLLGGTNDLTLEREYIYEQLQHIIDGHNEILEELVVLAKEFNISFSYERRYNKYSHLESEIYSINTLAIMNKALKNDDHDDDYIEQLDEKLTRFDHKLRSYEYAIDADENRMIELKTKIKDLDNSIGNRKEIILSLDLQIENIFNLIGVQIADFKF